MKDLPIDVAKAIYRKQYWIEPRFDQVNSISLAVAEELLDTGVNCGINFAKPLLQRAVSFTPEAGNDYEAWYSENNDTCSIKFNKITENKTDNLYSTQDFDNISMCK